MFGGFHCRNVAAEVYQSGAEVRPWFTVNPPVVAVRGTIILIPLGLNVIYYVLHYAAFLIVLGVGMLYHDDPDLQLTRRDAGGRDAGDAGVSRLQLLAAVHRRLLCAASHPLTPGACHGGPSVVCRSDRVCVGLEDGKFVVWSRRTLYALDRANLGLGRGARRADVEAAHPGGTRGHVLAQAQLTGTYERR